jgi:AcrR family transcriptional regulator
MNVSQEEMGTSAEDVRGPAARTRKLMLETAIRLMQSALTPSVSDITEAVGVSRATAYRYCQSQAAIVHAAVDHGLGPILQWSSDSDDVDERIGDLLKTSMPHISAFEATFKAAEEVYAINHWAACALIRAAIEEAAK